MIRSALTRRAPLRRGKPLARKTAMRRVRHDRIRARRAACFAEQAAACRRSHCPACGAWPCDPHHHPSRAAGGKDRDCAPLCRECHRAIHDLGPSEFYRRYGVDICSEVMRFRMVATQSAPVHSGRCTVASICDACQNAAEAANERMVGR